MSDLILGIDGGGTKTVAWLSSVTAARDDAPKGRGWAGPGNPRSAGFDVALANVETAIAAAFEDSGVPRHPVRVACLALAGADRPAERARLMEWCEQRAIADQVILTNDAEPLLAIASPENWGVALIAGTGSIAVGRGRSGPAARCGGWGYLLGDEGSGYAIALAGLRAAARAADGHSLPTQLLSLFQQRLQVDRPQGLIEALYRPEVQRQQIADLVDVVFDAARTGDGIANRILNSAAGELAELVQTLVERLQLPNNGFPLAFAGGVLLHNADFREAVERHLATTGIRPDGIALVPQPVRGAVLLARDAALRPLP